MRKSLYLLLAISLVFLMTSCRKEEGRGGKFTIKGKVYALFYDKDLSYKTGQGYLSDHDVYIIYGDADSYGDKISTSADGSFEFNFLRKGKYTIYTYSLDTTGNSPSGEKAISVDITISGDAETEDLVVVAEEKRLFKIRGKIKAEYYSLDNTTINSVAYIGDHDVYAVNLANPFSLEKATTSSDGSYEFNDLPKGEYKITTYYKNFQGTSNSGDVEVSYDTVIANSNIMMPDLTIKHEDEKMYTITGKLWLIEIDQFLIPVDQYYAGDIDVYIVYGNNPTFGERVRTSFDGTYQFVVPDGDYTIYAFSDDETGLNQHPIYKSKTTSVSGANVTLTDLTIYD